MNSFSVLADPTRRRVVELLADGDLAAGEIAAAVGAEFGIGQPAVSNQLRLLRDEGMVEVRADGSRRIYRLAPGGLDDVAGWVRRYSRLWPQRLDALGAELDRGRAARHERPTVT